MRVTALLLILTLPSLGLAQPVTSPAYPQVEPPADAPVARTLVPRETPPPLVEAAPTPLYTQWYFWAAIGATATVIAIVLGTVAASDGSHRSSPISQTEICGPSGCDACIGVSCR